MRKLAIVTTHPIQYYAPLFQLLNSRGRINIKVFYTLGKPGKPRNDPGFGKPVSWDIPLLEGYDFEWIQNTAAKPGSDHFCGVVNPGVTDRIKEWAPDAILIYGWAYHGHLQVMRFFKNKVPVYFRGDSTLLNEKPGLKQLFKTLFLRWVYRHVDHAFYVGQHNKAYFKKYGLKEHQLSFAPHAIDNKRFEEKRTDEVKELHASLNLNAEDILVLFAGKLEPVKNVATLLSAFINLDRENLHLLLVGNGVNEPELKSMAHASSYSSNIHFLDFKNQSYMPVLYQSADLFCLPSKSETWGLSVNEAMACSKAILVSDKVGCAPDLVKEGLNGAVFEAGSVPDLSATLDRITGSKNQLGELGRRSALMIGHWDFFHIAKEIEHKVLNG
ncbi:glycosyltransferase family 4 protein [Mucilaginibacter corticis]|uniref:Glycosyltransferase family 4 protein n=1 Tax=Mucilaginibacter corticis TaxID=2597670 RepID=A0A556M7W2_9SPHI|nr:glycosyltransferase family 4 protein [Mucilaginibacter corticis]TSJ35979.1 glycosyltransferase family 4 protein [Mucilaginibacter corticis]